MDVDKNAIIPLDSSKSSTCLLVDDYKDISLSETSKKFLTSIVNSVRTGLVSSAPIICQGPGNCPFVSRCPIYRADGADGLYPLSKQCIAEATIIQERFISYMDEVAKDDDQIDSATFRAQVSKLVELDLYDYRLSLILAGVGGVSDGSLLFEQTIAIDKDSGEEIKQLQEHPAFRMKSTIQKQRLELLDSMGLTVRRKAAIDAALHRRTEENFVSKSIELLERLASLEEAICKD